jgi:hypothetical protein
MMGFKGIFKRIGLFGVVASSAFGAPPPPIQKRWEDTHGSAVTPDEDGDIIGTNFTQGMHYPMRDMDEYLHRYEKLEELVSHDNDKGEFFWEKVNMVNEGDNTFVLRGRRNDGKEFSVRKQLGIDRNKDFDVLQFEFNQNLTEIA